MKRETPWRLRVIRLLVFAAWAARCWRGHRAGNRIPTIPLCQRRHVRTGRLKRVGDEQSGVNFDVDGGIDLAVVGPADLSAEALLLYAIRSTRK